MMKIGTHSGSFHCDEALACFMLKQLPQYREASIVRSRDLEVLSGCNVVVDVGGEYLPEGQRFDHHQRGFSETLSDAHTIKLSSAGLVYKHFGRQVISELLTLNAQQWNITSPATTENIESLYFKLYDNLIASIDAIDNGIYQYSSSQGEVDILYKVSTDLSARVGRLNPGWNETADDKVRDSLFANAVALTGTELCSILEGLVKSWLPARALISKAVDESKEWEEVVVLRESFPWKSALLELEIERGMIGHFKYVLYQDTAGMWRIQAVPESELKGFTSRIPLLESWRGLRDSELQSKSGVSDATFVHAAGFIGGAVSLQGVLRMAELSLQK